MEITMNNSQKKVLLAFIILFTVTIVFLPEQSSSPNGSQISFEGFTFLWNLYYEISIKTLLVEWFGLALIFIGLFFYFKSDIDAK
jgi:hypothetical protein